MSPAWDPKAWMWQNQDCSQLSLALEIKQGHPYLFPVQDGNNRAGGGTFLRSFFLSLADGGTPDHLTCFLSCWHGGHCPQPCCGCYAPLCLMAHASQVIVRLYLEPASHCGHCFISLLPFLSQCFERIVHACLYFFPICSLWRPRSLTSAPLPLLNLSLRGITHLHVGYVLCLLTEPFCCDCHSLYWETQDSWFSWDFCSSVSSTSVTVLLFRLSFRPRVVYRVLFLNACENLLVIFQKLCELADVMLVAWNWLWWSIDTWKLTSVKNQPPGHPNFLAFLGWMGFTFLRTLLQARFWKRPSPVRKCRAWD